MDTLQFFKKVIDWVTAFFEGPEIYELNTFTNNIKNEKIRDAVKQLINEIDEIGNYLELESEFLDNLYERAESIYENLDEHYLNEKNYNMCMDAIKLEFRGYKLRKQIDLDIKI